MSLDWTSTPCRSSAGRLGEEALGERDVLGVALEQDLVAAEPDRDARLALEDLEPLVARPGERDQDARVVDLELGRRLDARLFVLGIRGAPHAELDPPR